MIRVSGLRKVPETEYPYNPITRNHNMIACYSNGEILVMEYGLKIWSGFRRIKIRHLAITTARKIQINRFYDLMEIRNQVCGENAPAVQVYPVQSEIVDEADMVHLFVYPHGYKLPLTLRRKW